MAAHKRCTAAPMDSSHPHRRALRQTLLAIPLVLLGLEALWLIAANLLLRPGGVVSGWVNRKPEKVRMEWIEAWSYWPGDLRVKGFRIRIIQLTTQWSVAMDSARAQVGMSALLDKRFLARGLRSEGVVLRLRRLPGPNASPTKQSVLAPIPWAEFATRPSNAEVKAILAAQVRPPKKKVWAVDIPSAEARSVREIWINEFRYRGLGSAGGSFFVRPKERLNLDLTRLDVGAGVITLGADKVVEVSSGRVAAALPQINTVVYRGRDVFQKLDAKFTLEAGFLDTRFAKFYHDRFPTLNLSGTPGSLSVDGSVTEGNLQGSFALRGEDVQADYQGVSLWGDLRVDGRIERWVFADGEIDFSGTSASVTNVAMHEAGKRKPLADAWQGRATLENARLKLGEVSRLDTDIAAKIQNSRPLLEIFRGGKEVPWVMECTLSDRNLDARASIRVGGGLVEVSSFEVTGEKLHARSRLRWEKNREPHGILYLKRGVFSIGLETGGERNVKIIHPKEWFEEHPLLR